uniref:NADH-ubiquinone oxidoreductase chain 6 n=1 Tax=Caryopemon giganteus TaxID=2758555 RepID=A0A7D6V631_9CUCU|nr:NADH dehydrogenase subunit 6 [Caryopemon giganteus]QLX47632.1 NADH dehydrogenase subunit 6 [Caryopemon giganteus]
MKLIMLMLIINSCITPSLKHPLSLGLSLLIQTLLTALISGFLSINFWFSYILFLIMIGGMLILFIYMTSIASNEKFNLSFKIMLFSIIMMLMLTMFMLNKSMLVNLNLENTWIQTKYAMSLNSIHLNKYFNYPNNIIIMMIVTYLLITLIMVVKITKKNQGPIRQK